MDSFILPKGLRLEIVDNTNLTLPVGTKVTVSLDERVRFSDYSHGVLCMVDGDSITSMLPFDQCKIITDNFKKTFKP